MLNGNLIISLIKGVYDLMKSGYDGQWIGEVCAPVYVPIVELEKVSDNPVKEVEDLLERDVMACSWIIGQEYPKTRNYPIKIDKVFREDGPPRFAVRKSGRFCLTRDGYWEWESQPSSRTDEFLNRARYDTFEEAFEAYKQFGPKGKEFPKDGEE